MSAPQPVAPAVGQVWATSNSNSKMYVIGVAPDGSVTVTNEPLVAGQSGMALTYSPEIWSSIFENSEMTLETTGES